MTSDGEDRTSLLSSDFYARHWKQTLGGSIPVFLIELLFQNKRLVSENASNAVFRYATMGSWFLFMSCRPNKWKYIVLRGVCVYYAWYLGNGKR